MTEIRKKLSDYLAKFEAGTGNVFSVKPLELKKLHVVAFVQNDANKAVLQTAVVPVSGDLGAPVATQTPAPADKKPKSGSVDSTKPKPAKAGQPDGTKPPSKQAGEAVPKSKTNGPKLNPPK